MIGRSRRDQSRGSEKRGDDKIRLLRIYAINYIHFLRPFYRRRPYLVEAPHAVQLSALRDFLPFYCNQFPSYMSQLGYEVEDYLPGLRNLNEQWARENNYRWDVSRGVPDLTLERIHRFRPDVLFFQGNPELPHFVRRRIKLMFPFIRKVVIWKGAPGMADEMHDFDLVFAVNRAIADEFQAEGIPTELVYHSFDLAVLAKLGKPDSEPVISEECRHMLESRMGSADAIVCSDKEKFTGPYPEFVFAGASGFGNGNVHRQRYFALKRLVRDTPIELFVHEKDASEGGIAGMPEAPLRELFPGRCREPDFGTDMFRVLRNSRLTFNMHGDVVSGVGCMRLFEAPGVGTCLLSDTGDEMRELFREDAEIVTYSSVEEACEKATYLLNHEDEREVIARAGQERCLRDHLLPDRCRLIDQHLRSIL